MSVKHSQLCWLITFLGISSPIGPNLNVSLSADHAHLLRRSLSNIINVIKHVIKLQGHLLYILRVPVNSCTAHACRVWDILTSLSRVNCWSCLDISSFQPSDSLRHVSCFFFIFWKEHILHYSQSSCDLCLKSILILIGMRWFKSWLWLHVQVSLKQMLNCHVHVQYV